MSGFENNVAVALLWVAIQVMGLASALATRLSEGSLCQKAAQALFVTCLGLVGTSTMISLFVGDAWWLSSGTTFSLMVLGATCDLRGSRGAGAY